MLSLIELSRVESSSVDFVVVVVVLFFEDVVDKDVPFRSTSYPSSYAGHPIREGMSCQKVKGRALSDGIACESSHSRDIQ